MDISSLASTAVSMQAAKTQNSIGIALLKNQQIMDQSIVSMLDTAIQSAPAPEGTGLKVDRYA